MLGANPMASNGSLWTVPDFRKRLKAMQARGGKLVLIDPLRTETADVADAHHFIRPGADGALLLALLKVTSERKPQRRCRLASFPEGFVDWQASLAAPPPQRAPP